MKGFIALFALAISLTFSSVHAEEPNGPVNINTASAEELSELKGVGKTKAEAIVAHRNEHGEFSKVEDLTHGPTARAPAQSAAKRRAENPTLR